MDNNKIPPGPEDVPQLGYVKNFPMIVSIFNQDKLVREQKIDYGNIEHRKWLGRCTYWACSNGMSVETRKDE